MTRRDTTPTTILLLGCAAAVATAASARQWGPSDAPRRPAPAPSPASAPTPAQSTPATPARPAADESGEYEAYSRLGYKLLWRAAPRIERRASVLFFDPFGPRLAFQDTANNLTVMDASTGESIWTTQPDTALARFVGNTIVGDTLYCASEGELFEIDARTGEINQRHRLDQVVNTRPVIAGDVAVFGGARGMLGHSLRSTFRLWAYNTAAAITTDLAASPGATPRSPRAVGAIAQNGEILILDPANGRSTGRAKIFGGAAGAPVASAELLFIASLDQSIYAYQINGGALRWRHRAEQPITAPPTLHENALFVDIPGSGLTCFDAPSGLVRWVAKDVGGAVIGVRAGRLLVWDGETARALDPQRGDVIETSPLPGVRTLVCDPFVDGAIYAVTPAGRVSKFGPK